MQTKTLKDEMNPKEMLQALKDLGTEGLHEHTVKEMFEKLADGVPGDLSLEFFSGPLEQAAMQTIARAFQSFISDVVDCWKIAVFTQYQHAMWPKTLEAAVQEAQRLAEEGRNDEAMERINLMNTMSRQDLDNAEIGRTIIPERIPVSWGYL